MTPSVRRPQAVQHLVPPALELGAAWDEMFVNNLPTGEGIRRIEREHLEAAAGELAEFVESLSPPVREVVIRHACGRSLRSLRNDLKDRAYFSILDDWNAALVSIWREREDCVRRIL